jgi:formylglycine-generating enzyme
MKRAIRIVCACVVVSVLASHAAAVEIETVRIADANNTPDTEVMPIDGTSGYGAVAYEYNIGKYEVTSGQYVEFLNKTAGVDTHELYNSYMWSRVNGCRIERHAGVGSAQDPYRYRVAPDWANRPVNYVSWGDAARFANWLQNGQPTGPQDSSTTEDGAYYLNGATSSEDLAAVTRQSDWKWAIPSEDEWYKAAYYDGATGAYFDYPTGSDTAPGHVDADGNFTGTGGAFIEGGTDPGNYATSRAGNEIYGIGDPYQRTEVGEHENSASPYGTFDQAANVWEWNEGFVEMNPFPMPGMPPNVVMRGGAAYDSSLYQEAAYRSGYFPSGELASTGFRVSQVPEPASLSLLVLTGFALVRRKRGIRSRGV